MLVNVGVHENEARGEIGLVHFPVELIFASLPEIAPTIGAVEFAGSSFLKKIILNKFSN